MRLNRVIAVLSIVSIIFTGCNKSPQSSTVQATDNITNEQELQQALDMNKDDISSMKKPTFEQIATAREGSASDRIEGLVYQYVSDSVCIDIDNLGIVNENTDPQALDDIVRVIDRVNKALKTGTSTSIADDSILNYMLLEFANTPNTWVFDNTINPETNMPKSISVRGMDAATHLYFVDVTYSMGDGIKQVLPTSTIVKGSSDEEVLQKKLYTDYKVYIEDAKDEDGNWTYDNRGYPIFNNGHSKWDKYAAKERTTADAMYQLIFGKRYDSLLYGWTEDGSSTSEYTIYEDFDVNDNGDVITVYRRSDTNEIVFDEFTKPANFITGVTQGDTGKIDDGSFEARWGSLEEIYMTQNKTTLMERLRMTTSMDDIGVYTYPGLIESTQVEEATMTFRFVLQYEYNIGMSDYMSVRSIYLYNYDTGNMQEKLRDIYTTEEVRSKEVLSPFIERTLNAYRHAVESENHVGLNSLFVTYDKYDRYFEDIGKYTYVSNDGFIFDVIGRKGDEIAVIVQQRVQKRAKGTNMTFPTYIETSLMKLKLCDDDTVRIVSTTLMNTEIIGEPISIIRDVSGIAAQIEFEQGSFTKTNQTLVENCIAQFIGETINFDENSLLPVQVDIGVTDTTRASIKSTLKSITSEADGADRLVVFIKNYPTKSNIYTSASLRIVYIKNNSPVCEVNSVISLINRNNEWGIVSYTIDSLLNKASVAGADGCFVKITNSDDKPTYTFPGRVDNDMTTTTDVGNDIKVNGDKESNWSDEQS